MLLHNLHLLSNVYVTVAIARHLFGPLDLLLFCVLDLLNLLDVLLNLLVHVKQVELVDVCCVQGVLCLQLLRVLKVYGLVVLLIAALAAAFPFLLGVASGDQTAASMRVGEGSLGHQLGPRAALLVTLSVTADSALLEPATSDLNDGLRPLATVGAVDHDIILVQWLLVRGGLHAVLVLQVHRAVGLTARPRCVVAHRARRLLLLRWVLVEQLEGAAALRHLRACGATDQQIDALPAKILAVGRLLVVAGQGVELDAVVLNELGDSVGAQLVDLGVRALVAQLLARLVASGGDVARGRRRHQATLLYATIGATEVGHVLQELAVS